LLEVVGCDPVKWVGRENMLIPTPGGELTQKGRKGGFLFQKDWIEL